MQTKLYRAQDLGGALAQMRAEMGPEAVILYQRQAPHPRWWPFGRRGWEVLAGDDSSDLATARRTASDPLPFAGEQPGAARAGAARAGAQQAAEAQLSAAQVHADLAEIKASLARLIDVADLAHLPAAGPALTACYEQLIRKGVPADLAQELVLAAGAELSQAAQADLTLVQAAVRRQLESRVHVRAPQPVRGSGPLVIFLAGQSGVGKTTMLAKLAAQQVADGHRIAIFNADGGRMVAGGQLDGLASVLRAPVEAVKSAASFEQATLRHADKAVIFVDLPGVSHLDTAAVGELASMTRLAPRRQTFLVLACAAPLDEMAAIVSAFRALKLNGLILSKIDETATPGMALTLACRAETPVAYLSTGRRIPQDVTQASAPALAALLFGGAAFAAVQAHGPAGVSETGVSETGVSKTRVSTTGTRRGRKPKAAAVAPQPGTSEPARPPEAAPVEQPVLQAVAAPHPAVMGGTAVAPVFIGECDSMAGPAAAAPESVASRPAAPLRPQFAGRKSPANKTAAGSKAAPAAKAAASSASSGNAAPARRRASR